MNLIQLIKSILQPSSQSPSISSLTNLLNMHGSFYQVLSVVTLLKTCQNQTFNLQDHPCPMDNCLTNAINAQLTSLILPPLLLPTVILKWILSLLPSRRFMKTARVNKFLPKKLYRPNNINSFTMITEDLFDVMQTQTKSTYLSSGDVTCLLSKSNNNVDKISSTGDRK